MIPSPSSSCSTSSVTDASEKKAEANRKRSESMKRAWEIGKGTLGAKARREEMPCKCGCGKLAELDRMYAIGCYDHGAAQRGRKRSKEQIAKSAQTKRKRTMERRPLCACGCGKKTNRSGAQYATVKCVPRPGPSKETIAKYSGKFGGTRELMDSLRAMRNMETLKPKMSANLKKLNAEWKESGSLDEIRRKAGNATGMLDHISAKVWIIRDTYGNLYKFSNLSEWARKNQHRFVDDRPESRAPFWKRIAGGITDLLKKNGKSCSYRGWTAVSKQDFIEGGGDPLGRDYCEQNAH